MKFEQAKNADLPVLTRLWHSCFGDPQEEIRDFWKAVFPRIRVYIAREGKDVASMLCMLPTELIDSEGEAHSCGYVYAVCTDPKYRGKGISSKLLDHAHRHCGFDYAALVPAEESLFAFYRKQGYETAFFHRTYQVSAEKSPASVRPASPEVYRSIRELQLYDSFLSYEEFLLPRAGVLHRIETEEGIFCACSVKKDSVLEIRELLPDSPRAAAALCAHLGCTEAQVRTLGKEKPFGMLKSLKGLPPVEDAYLGLAFD